MDNPKRALKPPKAEKLYRLNGNKKGNIMKNFAKMTLLFALLVSGGFSFAQTAQTNFLNSTTQVEAKSKKSKSVRSFGFKFAS